MSDALPTYDDHAKDLLSVRKEKQKNEENLHLASNTSRKRIDIRNTYFLCIFSENANVRSESEDNGEKSTEPSLFHWC